MPNGTPGPIILAARVDAISASDSAFRKLLDVVLLAGEVTNPKYMYGSGLAREVTNQKWFLTLVGGALNPHIKR